MCKAKHEIVPKQICELFQETEQPYNLQNNHTFRTYNDETVQYGIEAQSFTRPKIWSWLLSNTKNPETLEIFKQKLKY